MNIQSVLDSGITVESASMEFKSLNEINSEALFLLNKMKRKPNKAIIIKMLLMNDHPLYVSSFPASRPNYRILVLSVTCAHASWMRNKGG